MYAPGHFENLESYIPVDLSQWEGMAQAFVFLLVLINVRYFLVAGLFWWGLYRPSQFGVWRKPLIKTAATFKQQKMEIGYSGLSSFIFAFAGVLMGWLWLNGYTQIYLKLSPMDLWYFPLSAFILAFTHDTYFYWTHRWLHLPKVFKKIHYVHHISRETSPWTSFSFHPVESLINALALPLIILVLPLHPIIIIFHLTLMTVTAVTNHLGVEILPKTLSRWGFHRHWISGIHHGQHHIHYKYNFALFFTWWDHWAKSEHPHFERDYNLYGPK